MPIIKQRKRKNIETPQIKLPSDDSDDNQEYKESQFSVEAIVGWRKVGKKNVYLVKWQDYPPSENTWEPEDNLGNCDDLIKNFMESQHYKEKYKQEPPQSPPKRNIGRSVQKGAKMSANKNDESRMNISILSQTRKRSQKTVSQANKNINQITPEKEIQQDLEKINDEEQTQNKQTKKTRQRKNQPQIDQSQIQQHQTSQKKRSKVQSLHTPNQQAQHTQQLQQSELKSQREQQQQQEGGTKNIRFKEEQKQQQNRKKRSQQQKVDQSNIGDNLNLSINPVNPVNRMKIDKIIRGRLNLVDHEKPVAELFVTYEGQDSDQDCQQNWVQYQDVKKEYPEKVLEYYEWFVQNQIAFTPYVRP